MTRRRVVGTLFLIVFLDLLGFGILIPVIPLYAKFFGANEFVGSLLIATYSLFQFIGAPILGRLSDERGRRPILLLSLSGSVIAWTLFGLAGELAIPIGIHAGDDPLASFEDAKRMVQLIRKYCSSGTRLADTSCSATVKRSSGLFQHS